jgi:hypothetical protein
MITGVVKFPEAWIRLEVRGRRGLKQEVDAMRDVVRAQVLGMAAGVILLSRPSRRL